MLKFVSCWKLETVEYITDYDEGEQDIVAANLYEYV